MSVHDPLRLTFVETYLDALRELEPSDVRRSPCFGYGRGGIAYALLRAGVLRGDAASIASARSWAAAGLRTARRFRLRGWPKASYSRGLAGLHAIAALAAHHAGDREASATELAQFVATCRRARGSLELFQGMAGRLAGAGIVARQLRDPGHPDVLALGDDLAARLVAAVRARSIGLPSDGIAHGAPGVLLGLLAWHDARGTRPAGVVAAAIRRVAPLDPTAPPFWSWGHAGEAHLFARAYAVLGEPELLARARAAGDRAFVAHRGVALVNGLTGMAYAMLALAGVDPDGPWRERASYLCDLAIQNAEVPEHCPYGVWSGLSGLFCLALDLHHGTPGGMPGIEA